MTASRDPCRHRALASWLSTNGLVGLLIGCSCSEVDSAQPAPKLADEATSDDEAIK